MGSILVRSTKKWRMQSCIRHFLVFFLVNPSSVRQYDLPYSCRGAPACGKRQIPVEKKTCSHYFEILFNAKTTFSCVSGIKRLQTSSVTVESLCPIYLLTVWIGTFWDRSKLQYVCLSPWQETCLNPYFVSSLVSMCAIVCGYKG